VVQKQLISSLVGVTSDKAKPIVYHNLHLIQKPFSHIKDSSGSVRVATILTPTKHNLQLLAREEPNHQLDLGSSFDDLLPSVCWHPC
jgi:hypothetical protein